MYISEVEGRGGIYAKVVADSISNGIRLTTLELNYPRFIHAEFMTHRMFSRNASSSRAIPVDKMLEQVRTNPAMPIHWGKNQPGMQADDEIDIAIREQMPNNWANMAARVAVIATSWRDLGIHKQVVNRILEPYQFIKVVVTATEWDNFFALRLHPDAQPEIQELARVMKEAMNTSTPKALSVGEWHIPYVGTGHSSCRLQQDHSSVKAAVARCARVSYLNHDRSNPDIEADIALHDRLLEAGHMSPFEHVATPMEGTTGYLVHEEPKGVTHMTRGGGLWSSNFRGWIQYRNLL